MVLPPPQVQVEVEAVLRMQLICISYPSSTKGLLALHYTHRALQYSNQDILGINFSWVIYLADF